MAGRWESPLLFAYNQGEKRQVPQQPRCGTALGLSDHAAAPARDTLVYFVHAASRGGWTSPIVSPLGSVGGETQPVCLSHMLN